MNNDAAMADLAPSVTFADGEPSSFNPVPVNHTSNSRSGPLFDPLYNAKQSITTQTQQPSHLHPLHSSSQTFYSQGQDPAHLSRDQYRHLISLIRNSISQFAVSDPALRLTPASVTSDQTSQETGAQANMIRRYISLLTETSNHTVALAHSIEPFRSESSRTLGKRKEVSSFPSSLHAGIFSSKQAKRPKQRLDDAVEALAALCDTLEKTAQSLGLEAFSEPAENVVAPTDASNPTLTHTLTMGAKILVIDVEFKILPGYSPKCRLKLSYATDSDQTQQLARDPKLGQVLERDIQSIAAHLFDDANDLHVGQEAVAKLLSNFASNLAKLEALDELSSKANSSTSLPVDLFDAMQKLSSAFFEVSRAEAEGASNSDEALLDRGHGISSLHGPSPFLRTAFAKDPVTQQDYTLSLTIEPLSLPLSNIKDTIPAPSFPLSSEAARILQTVSSPQNDPANALGSVTSTVQNNTIPLCFVVRLDPPVVVTRPTAARLASICRIAQPKPSASLPAAPATPDLPTLPTWFEDVLASSWATRPQVAPVDAKTNHLCTFTLTRTIESMRDSASQGLLVDSLPFLHPYGSNSNAMDESEAETSSSSDKLSTVSRIFAAIEVLRDEVKVTELLHSATASPEAASQSTHVALDELLTGSNTSSTPAHIPVTLSFRYPAASGESSTSSLLMLDIGFRVPIEGDNGSVVFTGSICPSSLSHEASWSVSAEARSPNHTIKLDSGSPESCSISARLQGPDSLERVVIGLIEWAQKELNVELKLPDRSQTNEETKFDPLHYEQQNVHAIYETIAPHFSSTRYKPWPLIPAFLSTIPQGSLGADLGCGNGKYLPLRSTLCLPSSTELGSRPHAEQLQNSLLTIGVDRSSNLVRLARDNFGMVDHVEGSNDTRRQEVAVGDAIQSSLRTGLFDYAISIATIHHFSTWERRRASVQELIRIISPVEPPSGEIDLTQSSTDPRLEGSQGKGRFMIFVWALEQKDEGKRQFEAKNPEQLKEAPEIEDPNKQKAKDRLVSYSGLTLAEQRLKEEEEARDRERANVTDDQDVLVPWVLTTAQKKDKEKKGRGRNKKAQKDETMEEAVASLQLTSTSSDAEHSKSAAPPVYNRYYHVFRSGELEALVADAGATMPSVHRHPGSGKLSRVEVVREASGWERGNWWGVWRVQWRQDASM